MQKIQKYCETSVKKVIFGSQEKAPRIHQQMTVVIFSLSEILLGVVEGFVLKIVRKGLKSARLLLVDQIPSI